MFYQGRHSASKERFAIKKLSVGVASVLVGTSVLVAPTVLAQEVISDDATSEAVESSPSPLVVEDSEISSDQGPAEETADTLSPVSEETSNQTSETQSQLAETPVSSEEAHTPTATSEEISETYQAETSTSASSQEVVSPQSRQEASVTEAVNQHTRATSGGNQATQEVTSASADSRGIRLQYNDSIANGEIIRFAVWTDNKGQDDLEWVQANASGAAYIEFSKHREYGKYHIHTYSSTRGGRNARTYDLAYPQVKTAVTKTGANTYQVTVSQVPNTISSISLPTWSDRNGQDDIKWYSTTKNSSGNYVATISTPEWGHYSLHVYGNSTVTGGLVGLTVTSGIEHVDGRKQAKVSVVDYAKDKTSFTVKVDGTAADTKTVTGVSIAAWSKNKGQDDLKWYTPKVTGNSASQTINIKDLSNTSDTYIVHVYTDYADGTRIGTVAGELNIQKPAERHVLTAKETAEGLSIKLDSNSISDLSTVRVAVWSNTKDQDDLKWYSANKQGLVVAPYRNHKDTGLYHIHAYQAINGQMRYLTMTNLTIAPANVKTSIKALDQVTYQVTISDVPYYITNVSVPTWSDTRGQDDIEWLSASKTGDRTYTAKISLKKHNFDTGHYSVHVYGQNQLENGRLVGLSVTNGFSVAKSVLQPTSVKVTDHNSSQGTLKVVVTETEASRPIKLVQVAAWSKANQGNIHWYEATMNGNKAVITVDERFHQYVAGDYTVHTYVTYTNGQKEGFNLGNYKLNKTQYTPKIETKYEGTGVYRITLTDVQYPEQVNVAVWSENKGQDDLRWYGANKVSDHIWNFTFDAKSHGDTGRYNVHVYQNGKGLLATTTDVSRANFDLPYYSQRDGRWASTYYGGYSMGYSGCVPTSFAMVATALKGSVITPVDVANYLYNQTNSFNKTDAGTSSRGIFEAASHYGFSATDLGSYNGLVNALSEGHYVLGAVQSNKFVHNGSHELVFAGYSNGNTYVRDPYNSANNGWYPVANLFREQSYAPEDRLGVAVPFVKVTKL